MALLGLIRRFMWVAPLVLGFVFIASGAYMIMEGRDAKDEVRQALVAEQVLTAKDASIPETPVTSVATADSQADIIREHSLKITEGKTYSQLDREDPRRDTYLNGVTLRTALNLAVMGFKVSDLVIGLGAFIIAIGATNVLVFAPALYWLRQSETARETETERPPRRIQQPLPG